MEYEESGDITLKIPEPPEHFSYESSFYSIETYSALGTLEKQEDALACIMKDKSAYLILCDGMGGLEEGRLAADTAIEAIRQLIESSVYESEPLELMRQAICRADEAVSHLTDTLGKKLKSGCTLVFIILQGKYMYWANVGDSRAYFLRDAQMGQITADHNYGELLKRKVQQGILSREEYFRELPRAAALTSYIGIGGVSEACICNQPYELQREDVVFVQSDGVYKLVTEDEMKAILAVNRRNLARAGEELLERAERNRRKYQDNTSLILARMK